jgi:hypothetical protein
LLKAWRQTLENLAKEKKFNGDARERNKDIQLTKLEGLKIEN